MNNIISKIRYHRAKKKIIQDPLINWSQITFCESNQKVKILFREQAQSYWKYCMAPIIFNCILYTFLKIQQIQPNSSLQSHTLLFYVEICLDTLKPNEKSLFDNLSEKELDTLVGSLGVLSSGKFSCEIKSPEHNSKRLLFKFSTKKQSKEVCQKIIKTSFFLFFVLIDRLRAYNKFKTDKISCSRTDLYGLRYLITSNLKNEDKTFKSPLQKFSQFKEQEHSFNQFCSVITLSNKSLADRFPNVSFAFAQNLQKRDQLQKLQKKSQEERKKQAKKQKIFSNIQIQKEENMKGFCIQTKFSIITQCNIVFKIIQTHMNRRYDFEKSAENQEYLSYLVNIAKTQSKLCVRKRPLLPSAQQKTRQSHKQEKMEQEIKEKAKKILKTQKNCLDIMKESWAENICPYYIYYKQDDTIYSKMYKMSLDEWKQSNLPCSDQVLLDIFLQILNGLYEMSAHKIIHRDLKPDNILIDDSNPLKPMVKLIDFGSTIFMHSDSQTYEQDVLENFDPKLRTTKPYNMDLNEFRKICYTESPQSLQKYTQSRYNRHSKFDIHSVGKIMEDFLQKIKNQQVLNNLKFLIKISTSPDPQYRLSLQETALFLRTIKNFYFSS